MAPTEVEVTIHSAKDVKNVNWRRGDLKPYAVVWIDPKTKCSTKVDEEGDTSPVWNETLTIPLHDCSIEDSILAIDIVHAYTDEDTKPLIGSARIPIKEIIDDVGFDEKCTNSLKLKRPSGRPQGKLEVTIKVRESRYYPAPAAYAPPYGQATREYGTPPYGYAPPPPPPQPYATAPPMGYPYNPAPYAYGQQSFGQSSYGQDPYARVEDKKGSKYGLGTGLAVGAVAGALGGLALAEGVDYVEDKIADDVAERVEDDLAYDEGFGGDDF